MNFNIHKSIVILLLSLLVNYSVKAQQIIESFENVGNLQSNDWVFINNSDSPSYVDWSQGDASNFTAQAGSSNSYVTNTTATTAANLVCNWLIMPDVGHIEQLSFYTRSQGITGEVTRMQVMYSPSGNFSAGICADGGDARHGSNIDFGTFQTLLAINQNQQSGAYPQDWTQYTVDVNGSGRIAFLYYVDTSAPNFNSGTLAIDTITKSNSTVVSTPQAIPTLGIYGVLFLLLTMLLLGYKNNRNFKKD